MPDLEPDDVEEYLASLDEADYKELIRKARDEHRGMTGAEVGLHEARKRFGDRKGALRG